MADENTPTGHPGHTVLSYDEELGRLGTMLAEMGGIVESQVGLAAEAMMEGDTSAATRAVELDPEVDELERRVEAFVIRLLALRQPVADDLRKIVAALKITGDLERIGDYAANAAKRSIVLAQYTLPISLAALANMARMVQQNLKTVIDAVGQGDADLAAEVWRSDRVIDDLYTAIFREAITYRGGCEFRPFCNPLYYMRQLDFPMSAAHAYHQATSDGQYDRKSSDDADSRSTLRARVHRIYLSAPVDAQAGAEV